MANGWGGARPGTGMPKGYRFTDEQLRRQAEGLKRYHERRRRALALLDAVEGIVK